MQHDIFSLSGGINQPVGKFDFGPLFSKIDVLNNYAIAQVVRWQLHKSSGMCGRTKTRSEVKGSGKKIYRQKGTGNARHSDKYAPQFRKGGVAHGPKGVQWTMSVPKKVKKLALKHTVFSKISNNNFLIFDDLSIDKPSTKSIISNFSGLDAKNILFIDNQSNSSSVVKSIRNVVGYRYLHINGLNVYDLIRADKVIVSRGVLDDLQKRLTI